MWLELEAELLDSLVAEVREQEEAATGVEEVETVLALMATGVEERASETVRAVREQEEAGTAVEEVEMAVVGKEPVTGAKRD